MSGSQATRAWMGGLPGVQVNIFECILLFTAFSDQEAEIRSDVGLLGEIVSHKAS